ncbi:RHS repeat-associated core domain-containing protein [Pseudomonas sp. JH-2]|uniref:RHS repeat domain-containing protein n=1 Tax=Pseudomonas sp. JH-2 TaxID=3114998 RepID=UPI002E26A56D|nr:RHS repeat-associated core domain-containing protein [Pseudomonas sp. JH-2]
MRQWIKLAGLCLLLLCGMVNANEVFVTYYHNDHLGSPVAATDETGNLLWREHYRPYGDRQDRPGYQGYGTLGFTGHAQNQANGLVYAGARYYDPLIGRFLSVDPKEASEETPGSFNRYAYSLNNPYGYSDPDGRWVAAALGVLDAGLTIHGIYSEYRRGGMEAAQAEVGKAVAAHLVGGLAGNVLRRGYILAKEGSIAAKATIAIPENRVGHIFRKAEGHIPDTPANRELLTNLANDNKSVLGVDRHGTIWSAKLLPDGSQAWVQTRGGQVINGGINKAPKPYDPERGLASLKPRGSKDGK